MDNRFFKIATIESWRYWGCCFAVLVYFFIAQYSQLLFSHLGKWAAIIYILPLALFLEFATSRKYAHPKTGFALVDCLKYKIKQNWNLLIFPIGFAIGVFLAKNANLSMASISCLGTLIFFLIYRKKP